MQTAESIQLIATISEMAVALLALLVAWKRKKMYSGFIAITFALFVIFDIDRILSLNFAPDLHAIIFLLACLSMLYAVWLIGNEK